MKNFRCLIPMVIALMFGFSFSSAANFTFLDLSNNNGIENLFTAGGTTFTNVDGSGTDLTMLGVINGGDVQTPLLNDDVISISSSKSGNDNVNYSIVYTFTSLVSDLGFASRDITNQETLTLDLTLNSEGGVWTGNILQLNTWGSYTGLGTPVITGTGPGGGVSVSSVTVSNVDINSFEYTYQHESGNVISEEFALVFVPEPSSAILVLLGSLFLFYTTRRL